MLQDGVVSVQAKNERRLALQCMNRSAERPRGCSAACLPRLCVKQWSSGHIRVYEQAPKADIWRW